LFEGTPEKLLHSLERLAALPETTRVFCGHEYTLANLTFAAAAEPGNDEITAWRRQVEALRQQGEPSLPSSIARERQVNPFLRIEQPGVIASVERWSGNTLSDKVRRFAALRRWKDEFQEIQHLQGRGANDDSQVWRPGWRARAGRMCNKRHRRAAGRRQRDRGHLGCRNRTHGVRGRRTRRRR